MTGRETPLRCGWFFTKHDPCFRPAVKANDVYQSCGNDGVVFACAVHPHDVSCRDHGLRIHISLGPDRPLNEGDLSDVVGRAICARRANGEEVLA